MMSAAVQSEPYDSLRLILVEDNPGDVILVKRALKRVNPGIEVVPADSAEAALELLAADTQGFDLMLLDLNLPHMNGLDLLKRVKSEAWLRKMPVIVLSSSNAPEDVSESYANHANGYIVKPMGMGDYDRLAHFINDSWFGMMERPPVMPSTPDEGL